jgi:hypothetical protein
LIKNPKQRLGAAGGGNEILSHPWYKDIDPKVIQNMQVEPPYKPNINEDEFLSNFDKEFTDQEVRPSEATKEEDEEL